MSAWLAEAARDRLRLEALGDAVAVWKEQFGALTDAEVAEADRLLETGRPPRGRPGRPGRAGGAAPE